MHRDRRRGGRSEGPTGVLPERECTPHIYFPAEQQDLWLIDNGILLKVSGDTKSVLPGIRGELLALGPQVRVADVTPLREMLDQGTRSWRLGATLFSIFGLLALIIAGVGLYSILAYAVAQRRFELGIRSALGARRGQLIALVFQSGMSLAGVGVMAGIAACYLLAPLIEDLLFEVSPRDPITLFLVAVTLLAVARTCERCPGKTGDSNRSGRPLTGRVSLR
jgi:ABC-type antimicrobial peptide transport system permease subunit